jgi:dTDP-4-amino-4,6-dideoxygalactose transaminase
MYNKHQIKLVANILKKNKTNYWTGTECTKFEKTFSKYIGNKFSISVANGSVALEISIKALNLKNSDQIIVTPRSFIISASCVVNLGLKPIFADIDDNGNLTIEGIKKAYNKNVKAIILVHLNGLSCDMDPILKFAKNNKLFLIEDCSQAHGATYKKKKVGSFGDIATWSFCQDKIISTGGEGGMISTNNKKLWSKMWSLKDHGKNFKTVFHKKRYKAGFKWLHDNLGSNYRMTEMQAAIGRDQLKSLDKKIKKRNNIVNLYLYELRDYYQKYSILKKPDFKCQTCPLKQQLKKCTKCIHAFYRLNLFFNKNIKQIKILQKLNSNKINCGVGSCPEIYREKVFQKLKYFPKNRLKNAKLLGQTSLMFPINPHKSHILIKEEILKIKKIFNQYL